MRGRNTKWKKTGTGKIEFPASSTSSRKLCRNTFAHPYHFLLFSILDFLLPGVLPGEGTETQGPSIWGPSPSAIMRTATAYLDLCHLMITSETLFGSYFSTKLTGWPVCVARWTFSHSSSWRSISFAQSSAAVAAAAAVPWVCECVWTPRSWVCLCVCARARIKINDRVGPDKCWSLPASLFLRYAAPP